MNCAHCRADIEDDSFYCDQCGREIMLCSKCGKPGARKVCTTCGAKLVPAKDKTAASMGATSSVIQPHPGHVSSGATSTMHLVNRNLNLDLEVSDGDVLGRVTGRFAAPLASQERISGRHASFSLDPGRGWLVTDVGSTNGTKLNGVRLSPGQAHALRDGCVLQIANVEFYVQMADRQGPTGTVRDNA